MEISGLTPMQPMSRGTMERVPQTAAQTEMQLATDMDKLITLAIAQALMADGDKDKGENPILQAVVLALLFGNDVDVSGVDSPMEQAKMIADILSSGQPGSFSLAMGIKDGGAGQGMTYNAAGATVMGAPVVGAMSVSA